MPLRNALNIHLKSPLIVEQFFNEVKAKKKPNIWVLSMIGVAFSPIQFNLALKKGVFLTKLHFYIKCSMDISGKE